MTTGAGARGGYRRPPPGRGPEAELDQLARLADSLLGGAGAGEQHSALARFATGSAELQRRLEEELFRALGGGRPVAAQAARLHRLLLLREQVLGKLIEPFREAASRPMVTPRAGGAARASEAAGRGLRHGGRSQADGKLLLQTRAANDAERRVVVKLLHQIDPRSGRWRTEPRFLADLLPTLPAEECWPMLAHGVERVEPGVLVELDAEREEALVRSLEAARRKRRPPQLLGGTLRRAVRRPRPPRSDAGDEAAAPAPPDAPDAASATEELRRTPHLELSEPQPLPPEAAFAVTVWADLEAARAGEESEEIRLELPPEVAAAELQVQLLPSPHFELVAAPAEPLRIARAEPSSNRLRYELRVRSADELAALAGDARRVDRGWVTAYFLYRGRPSGSVRREVEIDLPQAAAAAEAGEPAAAEPEPEPRSRAALAVDQSARPADLTIHVKRVEPGNERHFECTVTTALASTTQEWKLAERTSEMVASYMDRFIASDSSPRQRQAALRAAGYQLFRAAPENFRQAFWRSVEHGPKPRTILVVSEEPYFPWELVIPKGDGHAERPALGAEFSVGRWVTDDSVSPRQELVLADSYVIAPRYQRRALAKAEDEARRVRERFRGEAIEPTTFDEIDSRLKERPVSLIHLVCHGKQSTAVEQEILLDDEATLNTLDVEGSRGFQRALAAAHPLIFLNACEVGRPSPQLVGVGGFASTFIGLGAGAVIAALWSVKDTIAHEVANEFYDQIEAHPETPFAELFRRLRQRSYDEDDDAPEDTWAAYCFYGDPLARARLVPADAPDSG